MEIILRDKRAVIPIDAYNARYGVTLSLPSVLGRGSLEPEMAAHERRALHKSADTLRAAVARAGVSAR